MEYWESGSCRKERFVKIFVYIKLISKIYRAAFVRSKPESLIYWADPHRIEGYSWK